AGGAATGAIGAGGTATGAGAIGAGSGTVLAAGPSVSPRVARWTATPVPPATARDHRRSGTPGQRRVFWDDQPTRSDDAPVHDVIALPAWKREHVSVIRCALLVSLL